MRSVASTRCSSARRMRSSSRLVDRVEFAADRRRRGRIRGRPRPFAPRVEAGRRSSSTSRRAMSRMRRERVLDVRLAEQRAESGAGSGCRRGATRPRATTRPAPSTSRLKPSSSARPSTHREERVFEQCARGPGRRTRRSRRPQPEPLDPARLRARPASDSYGCSSSTTHAHVRQAGEHLRQRRLRDRGRRA